MNKQEAIQSAYAGSWDNVKEHVNGDGWMGYWLKRELKALNIEFEEKQTISSTLIRPKSISGIEHNNYWTSIKSEADLPKEDGTYFIVCNGKVDVYNFIRERTEDDIREVEYWLSEITHYQPMTKPQPPIY